MCPRDTSPEAWKLYLELQRRLTPGEKLSRALEHSRFTRSLALAGLRRRFPEASEHEILLKFARQTLDPELFEKAYGEPTAEDILLAKLRRYRDGGEVSERQWNDIAGIVAANASLDLDYLRNWAARLGVDD